MGTCTQSQCPLAALDLQRVPAGQTPPQSGAGLCVQGIATSWQSPPQVGNGLCEHGRGGCAHSQTPAEFNVQASPAGQAPLHDGAELFPHGTTMSTQLQWFVTVFTLQVWLAGQTPPHWGARAWSHGPLFGAQPHPVGLGVHVEPAGHTPPHCGGGLWPHWTV